MTLKEFFHDHPVIDERHDDIYMYFHDLPPMLLKKYIHPEEKPLDEED